MQQGRRIAFDYGEVRIGVAICDRDGILATPLTTLSSKDAKVIDQIANLIAEYQPIVLYVGDPKNLSGNSSTSAEKAQLFAAQLTDRFNIPVVMVDERLSTVTAASALRENGLNTKEARSKIDMAAAVSILEHALRLERNRDA